MKNHIIIVKENYYCAYIPSARSQKYAFDEVEGEIKVSIPSVTDQEAPVAFRLSDFHHRKHNRTEIRWYGGKCWKPMVKWDIESGGDFSRLEADRMNRVLRADLPHGYARNREACIKKYREAAKGFIIVDGYIWRVTGEPCYVINTFGLGHNHGGTGLFVENWYNSNISRERYFSALEGDKAVSEANRIAKRRGDTDDVGKFEKMIEVLIPEAVSINPLQEHGEGDPFQNKLNAITEAAPDSTTAGLLAIMATAQELEK